MTQIDRRGLLKGTGAGFAALGLPRPLGQVERIFAREDPRPEVSVRALAWMIAGHELHHRALLESRYLV